MGTLFESTRKYWIFIEKVQDIGSGEVLDEQGARLGQLHRVTVDTGGKIELKDNDGTKVCEIRKKIGPIENIYELNDGAGKNLVRIKKAITSNIKRTLRLETGDNKRLFVAIGKTLGCNYVIFDGSGNEVAGVNKLGMREEVLDKGAFVIKKKFSLHINDAYVGKVDARQLVGFVIAIEDISRD